MYERRFRPDEHPARLRCRVCFADIRLDPERIHRDGYFWIMQCPECGAAFPVRTGDAGR
ncbi:MAG: hypothetical protein ACREN5_15860 [Gemmatimonadales bacterium]